eukprot:TRINITY_DN4981_c0_g1_i2.p1 TRINITY_DN4981_c0_g1~~TRINITY_DN4981_c0_g1_i2.p1  ORF type:complete len:325 (+),score=45.54 TRINITY_DN4981_c0_g1_i2:627-1601(+)
MTRPLWRSFPQKQRGPSTLASRCCNVDCPYEDDIDCFTLQLYYTGHLTRFCTKMSLTLGFVGVGTINGAIVSGLCRVKDEDNKHFKFPLRVSLRGKDKVQKLVEEFGDKIEVCTDNESVVAQSQVVFLGVTPKVAEDVLPSIASKVTKEHLIVNLVATIPIARCRAMLGDRCEVVKAVPLPPVAHHKGMTVICPKSDVCTILFDLLGSSVTVESEHQQRAMQAATSQMGPLYAQCRMLQHWLQDKGVPADTAAHFSGGFYNCISHDALVYGKEKGSTAFDTLISEQTPGGLNEQAVKELTELGVYKNQEGVLDHVLARLQNAAK